MLPEALREEKKALLAAIEQLKASPLITSTTTAVQRVDEEQIAEVRADAKARRKALIRELKEAKQRLAETRRRRLMVQEAVVEATQCKTEMDMKLNTLSQAWRSQVDVLESIRVETTLSSQQLQIFMQLNVLNDAFYIWYAGPFATINNHRLGRTPSFQVDWTEINTALGSAALLLTTVETKAGYKFRKYEIYPMGSFTKLTRTDDRRTMLNLFTDGSFSIFPKRNFNLALTGFLTCIAELGARVAEQDPTLQMPYTIEEDRIHGVPLAVGGADDDVNLTRALKYALTNIKWIVAWAAKHLQNAP